MLDRPVRAGAEGLPKESSSALVNVMDRLDDLKRTVAAERATAGDEEQRGAVARLAARVADLEALVDLAIKFTDIKPRDERILREAIQ